MGQPHKKREEVLLREVRQGPYSVMVPEDWERVAEGDEQPTDLGWHLRDQFDVDGFMSHALTGVSPKDFCWGWGRTRKRRPHENTLVLRQVDPVERRLKAEDEATDDWGMPK